VSKTLSLFFALSSTVLMLVTAFSISHSGWLALLFGILTIAVMGAGFIVKAKLRKKSA